MIALTRYNRVHRPGTTLTELVVAVTLLAVIMAVVLPFVSSTRKSWDVARSNMEAVQDGRVLTTHLNRYLSQAVCITNVSLASETLGGIVFEDENGDTHSYKVDTDGNVEYGPVGSEQDLAGPVSLFQFTCYAHTDLVNPTTNVSAIRFVKVQTTVTNAGSFGQDRSLSTSIFLQANKQTPFEMGTPERFDGSLGKTPALSQIDGSRFLCAYAGQNDTGLAKLLAVDTDTWDITTGSSLTFDNNKGMTPALVTIDTSNHLCVYTGNNDEGWATILTVDTGNWTLAEGTDLRFDSNKCIAPALSQIDDSHYLCAYQGNSDVGSAVILNTGSSLVGHWKLDESSGTTAADSSGYGNDGTLTNMAGNEWTTGLVDGALDFDGSSDHIAVPNATSLQPTSELSIAAWIKGDAWGSGSDVDPILRKGGSTPVNYQLAVADGVVSLMLDDSDGGGGIRGDTALNTGQWYHVAATWDGSNVRIYVNGALDNDPPDSRSGSIGTDTRSLYLGGRDTDDYFDGILDDVRFYNNTLSATEIAALAQTLRYENFTEARATSDTTSVTVATPAGTSEGDLLIAAVATDSGTTASLAPPGGEGWTQIELDTQNDHVTLGAWWKLAAASESSSHSFTWTGDQQAYAWIMRFTGHDPSDPIDVSTESGQSGTATPTSPAVTTTVDNSLILRLGAFSNDSLTVDDPGLSGHTAITMDSSSGSGQVSFEEFTEAKLTVNSTSLSIDTPPGASAGDLLIAAVVTDGNTNGSLAPPGGEGWTQIRLDDKGGIVTFGAWWKLGDASEPASHLFTWSSNQRSYGWIMRFTGHDPSAPIHQNAKAEGSSSSPNCPSVTTTLANCLILSLGGFDDDDVTHNSSGLEGHTTITMDESNSGSGTCSGGAGYQQQADPGTSASADFNLTASEDYVNITVALAPNTSGGGVGAVSGGAGYVRQTAAGSSGTSSFSLTDAEKAQMVTLAIAPAATGGGGGGGGGGALVLSKGSNFTFDSNKGMAPALAPIDSTHQLCVYSDTDEDGRAVVLTVNTGAGTISKGTSSEFDSGKGKTPALIQIDSTHFLCAYTDENDQGRAVVLTVNTGTWTVSKGTSFVFDSGKGMAPALSQMDTTNYLCAYGDGSDKGQALVLVVDTGAWTITKGSPFEFEGSKAQYPALESILSSHHLCAYQGNNDNGWSVVLIPSITNIQP